MNYTDLQPLTAPVLTIYRSDRWQICHRLQELQISADCLPNGQLQVEIQCPIDILQLRSVIQGATASRADLLDWLKRCWQSPNHSTPNN